MFSDINWVAVLSNSHVQVALLTMVVTMAFHNLLGRLIAMMFNGLMAMTIWRSLTPDEIAKREIVPLPVKVERMAQNHTECLVQNATLISKVEVLEKQLTKLFDRLGVDLGD